MADKKISALTALTAANVALATDVVPIVDTSATETKKVTAKDLVDGALNGGTANGVLYLNGSKAATSGTALVFDGTNLGIGTSSPTRKVSIVGSASATYANINSGDNTSLVGILLGGTSTPSAGQLVYDNTGNSMRFFANGSEFMRLDSSGNFGIGTSSPTQRLDVAGNIRALNSGADSQVIATAPTDSFSPFIRWGVSGIRDSGILGFPAGDDALVYRSGANSFSTGTERFRITAVGNVVAGGSVALATTATNGFLYVPTCAGTPTGTPTSITGMAPIVVNTTNNKLYFYSGGAWRDAGP